MIRIDSHYFRDVRAGVAQLVEHKLPKLGVAGSNPVARSSPGDAPSVKKASLFEVDAGWACRLRRGHFDERMAGL